MQEIYDQFWTDVAEHNRNVHQKEKKIKKDLQRLKRVKH
jgi:hypothetical protein